MNLPGKVVLITGGKRIGASVAAAVAAKGADVVLTYHRSQIEAEATAGGVALDEVDRGTMASKRCERLFFAGEMLDVDGRLGGFNFQWAWSSAFVAARGLARPCRGDTRWLNEVVVHRPRPDGVRWRST
jgi:NAD(P)-dependent dehydrogenase (short-subunit alcohol dehydrogenase family)